jgi:hypothetical protein
MNEMLDIELQFVDCFFFCLSASFHIASLPEGFPSVLCCGLQWLIRFVFAELEELTGQKPHPPKPQILHKSPSLWYQSPMILCFLSFEEMIFSNINEKFNYSNPNINANSNIIFFPF